MDRPSNSLRCTGSLTSRSASMMACTGIFYTYKMKSNAASRRQLKLMTFLFVLFQSILGVSTMPTWIKREIWFTCHIAIVITAWVLMKRTSIKPWHQKSSLTWRGYSQRPLTRSSNSMQTCGKNHISSRSPKRSSLCRIWLTTYSVG